MISAFHQGRARANQSAIGNWQSEMTHGHLIQQLPFFTPEHLDLVTGVASFAKDEIEARATEEREVEESIRYCVDVLAGAGLLNYAVASHKTRLDVRALCLIREILSYSSALADVAFVMQGLGTYAISQAAPGTRKRFLANTRRGRKSNRRIRLNGTGSGL